MAVSSKKRKNGAVKKSSGKRYLKISPELLSVFRDAYTRAELAIELKLPRGTMELQDFLYAKDMFNLATLGFVSRDWLDQHEIDGFVDEFCAAKKHFSDVWKRGRETQRFICTGEELNSIRNVIAVIGQYIQESLTACPMRMLKEWCTMEALCESPRIMDRTLVTKEDIDRAMAKITGEFIYNRLQRMRYTAQRVTLIEERHVANSN